MDSDEDRPVYYRFEDSSSTEEGAFVHERRIPVAKLTPRGVWLDDYGLPRFVLDGDGKRFAYPTREAAWASFLIRKRRQLGHLQAQLRHVEYVHTHVKDMPVPDASVGHCWQLGTPVLGLVPTAFLT